MRHRPGGGGGPPPVAQLRPPRRYARNHPSSAPLPTDAAIEPGMVRAILDQVPGHRMSEVTKIFTERLLTVNQARLLLESLP